MVFGDALEHEAMPYTATHTDLFADDWEVML